MNEPLSKEDIAKLEAHVAAMKLSVENMRAQNSAEHGSLFTKLLHITELLHWIRAKWERFTRGPDGNVPPPERPKDDTQ